MAASRGGYKTLTHSRGTFNSEQVRVYSANGMTKPGIPISYGALSANSSFSLCV